MKLTWKLFAANVRQQKVRFALTALGMVGAVGVVLWVVSAYEAIASGFDNQTANFVGNFSLFVVPQSAEGALSPELISKVEGDPLVALVNPVTQFRMAFRKANDTAPPAGRRMGPLGPSVVGTQSAEPRYPLVDGRWIMPDTETEAVVSNGVAEALSLKPGDAIEFRTSGGPLALTVVGITEQVKDVETAMTRTKGGAPGGVNRGPASLTAYVPLGIMEKLTGKPAKINLLEIRLREGEKTIDSFQAGFTAHLASQSAELLLPADIRGKIEKGFAAEGARKQAYFVTALSILVSAFIIFTTLSMGVNERARQLAMLRAVGLSRSQVASLVLVEAFVLAVFGWVGGLAGGWALLKILSSASPELFPNGIAPGATTLITTAACSLVGALLASIFPIWKATRISPIEAMAPLPTVARGPEWYVALGLGSLTLMAINPLLTYLPNLPEVVRFTLVLMVGAPAAVAGFVLAAPLAVLLVERYLAPPVAWVLRLQSNLLRTQLSSHLWRSAGLAASLMLGLGLYTTTQVWGWSMLGGFLPGRWTPGVIVKFDPGISEESFEQVRNLPGIQADSCLPVAIEQVKLAGDPLNSTERDSAVRQDNVALIGVDAEAAFTSTSSPFQLTFVQGDRTEALAKLREGRYCLVPDTFPKYAGLGVGDKISLIPPNSPDRAIAYTIAGVVAMPGSNWITKTSGIRRQSVRTAGLVFAPRAQVQEDFDLKRIEFVWFNAQPGTTKAELEESLRPFAAPGRGPAAANAAGALPGGELKEGSRASLKGASKETANEGKKAAVAREGARGEGKKGARTEKGGGGRRGGPAEPLQVTLIDDVRDGLATRGGATIQALGWLPLITLLVVSLGVVNTVAASVRARRWEFGILRSVGLRRFSLTRLVFAEALLIGFVASLLSFSFGLLTGWTCLGLVRYVSNPWFEGVATPLVIPWSSLALGYGMMFVLCFLAALWPAISAGRSEPLTLLQKGRSMM